MIVIFGWRKTAKPVASVLKTECFRCKNRSGWSVWKETEWVSLFFVKVIPFLGRYHLVCNICDDAIPLSNSVARDILDPKKRTNELHDALVESIEKYQFEGMTETKNNSGNQSFRTKPIYNVYMAAALKRKYSPLGIGS